MSDGIGKSRLDIGVLKIHGQKKAFFDTNESFLKLHIGKNLEISFYKTLRQQFGFFKTFEKILLKIF